MQKMIINLWFDNQALEAAHFYTTIFPNSKIGRIAYYTKEGFEFHGKPEGSVMTVEFEINGNKFMALNGGQQFKFNESISFILNCDTQDEIDYYWEKLSTGGNPDAQQCGWLKDKYGVSWQIDSILTADMIYDPDRQKVEKVMKAILAMKKLDIQSLIKVYEG